MSDVAKLTERCWDDCPHRMISRCPACHREMYALAVWDFSHGEARCSNCGYLVTPSRDSVPPGEDPAT